MQSNMMIPKILRFFSVPALVARHGSSSANAFAASSASSIFPNSKRPHVHDNRDCRRSYAGTTPLAMAAPGVEVASKDDLKSAMDNPETIVLDIRSVEEIAASGVWETGARWAHAPGTPQENPLLSTAAKALIPDTTTPVIVHCAKGFRAAKAKEILEAQGYTNVMNAGGYPEDMQDL